MRMANMMKAAAFRSICIIGGGRPYTLKIKRALIPAGISCRVAMAVI